MKMKKKNRTKKDDDESVGFIVVWYMPVVFLAVNLIIFLFGLVFFVSFIICVGPHQREEEKL